MGICPDGDCSELTKRTHDVSLFHLVSSEHRGFLGSFWMQESYLVKARRDRTMDSVTAPLCSWTRTPEAGAFPVDSSFSKAVFFVKHPAADAPQRYMDLVRYTCSSFVSPFFMVFPWSTARSLSPASLHLLIERSISKGQLSSGCQNHATELGGPIPSDEPKHPSVEAW